jgi:5,10-methylenetetrahydrofolate reductase
VLYSFEVFPPKAAEGTASLLARVDSLALHEPLFVDVTWAGGIECLQPVLTVASHAQKVWWRLDGYLSCSRFPCVQ